ncbi:MAG: hypothetical protein ACI4MS_05695 [Candidatus Coproplasma sp.]
MKCGLRTHCLSLIVARVSADTPTWLPSLGGSCHIFVTDEGFILNLSSL